MEGRGFDCSGSEYGEWEGSYECGNEPGSRKCGEFPGQLRNSSLYRRTLFLRGGWWVGWFVGWSFIYLFTRSVT